MTLPRPTVPRLATALRFSPTAWAKLLFLRDAGPTEIGGFGIAPRDDLLRIDDIRLVDQECTAASVHFADQAVADFFDVEVDAGRVPAQFARVWIHTHPASSAQPSGTDEETFSRVFGRSEWAVMCILARGGQTYARLRFHVGPGADVLLPVEVDYRHAFDAADFDGWRGEYQTRVTVPPEPRRKFRAAESGTDFDNDADAFRSLAPPTWYDDWYEYLSGRSFPEETIDGYVRDLE